MCSKRFYSPPPFDRIQAAVQGDYAEIEAIMRHYERYMIALSLRPCQDKDGDVNMKIDPEILRRMESKLIDRILKFKIY